MPISILYTENARQGTDKINQIFGIESGALADPWQLTFNIQQRIRTLTVNEDIELALTSSGKISYTYEVIETTGDGTHVLTFPTSWAMSGDLFSPYKRQRIVFLWDGVYVQGVISNLAEFPILTSAKIEDATDNILDVVFSKSVTVASAASGSGTTWHLTLSRSIGSSETVTVSYSAGAWTMSATGGSVTVTGGAVTDSLGNTLNAVSGFSVTNNVYTINLDVPFTGTSIDTGAGTVTNPDIANLTISQNNKLIFTRTTDTAVASVLANYWRSVSTYTRGAFAVLGNRDSGFTNSFPCFMYRVDANNYIAFIGGGVSVWEVRVVKANVTVYTLTTAISTSNRIRMVYTASNVITFEYWNGSIWAQIGTYTDNIGSAGNIQLSTSSNASDAQNHAYSYDALYVTDKEYSTVTP